MNLINNYINLTKILHWFNGSVEYMYSYEGVHFIIFQYKLDNKPFQPSWLRKHLTFIVKRTKI